MQTALLQKTHLSVEKIKGIVQEIKGLQSALKEIRYIIVSDAKT